LKNETVLIENDNIGGDAMKLAVSMVLTTLYLAAFVTVCDTRSSFAYQNEPKDFRGVVWASNINERSDMGLKKSFKDLKFYSRTNDPLKFGEGTVKSISYLFCSEKFCSVMIDFSSRENFERIKYELFRLHGPGDKNTRSPMEEYHWRGNVNILLLYSDRNDEGSVTYSYKPTAD
jgi:hypothetical protein